MRVHKHGLTNYNTYTERIKNAVRAHRARLHIYVCKLYCYKYDSICILFIHGVLANSYRADVVCARGDVSNNRRDRVIIHYDVITWSTLGETHRYILSFLGYRLCALCTGCVGMSGNTLPDYCKAPRAWRGLTIFRPFFSSRALRQRLSVRPKTADGHEDAFVQCIVVWLCS